MEEYLKKH